MTETTFVLRATGTSLILFALFLVGSTMTWPICLMVLIYRFYKAKAYRAYCRWRRRKDYAGLTKEQKVAAHAMGLAGIRASEKSSWKEIVDIWHGKLTEEKTDDAE